MNGPQPSMPVEEFVKAICTQLDRVQYMLALKARAGLPLSFAVKDVSLQLRTHLETVGTEVRIRCAGPEDREASTISFTFASIARNAMMENTEGLLAEDHGEEQDDDWEGSLDEDARRRLEMAGIRSSRQLRDVQQRAGESSIRAVTQLPIERLRAALNRANRPFVTNVRAEVNHPQAVAGAPVLRVAGRNLIRGGILPTVAIDGRRAAVIQSSDVELVIAPIEPVYAGVLSIETGDGLSTQTPMRLTPPANGNGSALHPVQRGEGGGGDAD